MSSDVRGTKPSAYEGTGSFQSRTILLVLMALCMSSQRLRGQKEVPSSEVILEIINQHITVGLRIPSAYLTVFSDGTVECHTLKFDGRETDVVKRRILTPREFDDLRAAIEDDDLLHVKKKYQLISNVADSWMEWHIRIPRKIGAEEIVVANFIPMSPGSYPRAVLRLGCLISRLRDEVYDDELLHQKCRKILDAK